MREKMVSLYSYLTDTVIDLESGIRTRIAQHACVDHTAATCQVIEHRERQALHALSESMVHAQPYPEVMMRLRQPCKG